jgi:hypothetical protein
LDGLADRLNKLGIDPGAGDVLCAKTCALKAALDFQECSTTSVPQAFCESNPKFQACEGNNAPEVLCANVVRESQDTCNADLCNKN